MLSNQGVPENCEDIHYFEFHFKVETKTNEQWNLVSEICAKYGSHLFFNPYSKTGTMLPVVTLRRYDVSKSSAKEELEKLQKELKDAGFELSSTEQEYSIWDSRVEMDRGWLFVDNPREFIRSIPIQVT